MKKSLIFMGSLMSPAIVLAATADSVLSQVNKLLQSIVPILITLAIIYFFWGLGMYILNAGNEEKKAQGRSVMIWGVVALFVMVSVWGLVGLIGDTFDIDYGRSVPVVKLPN